MRLTNIEKCYSLQKEWKNEYKNFKKFINSPPLINLLTEANGPYPAGHGLKHVNNMINIIDSLFNENCKIKFAINDVFDLMTAIYIHDVGMIHMISTGSNDDESRKNHSNISVIKEIITNKNILDNFYDKIRQERIILIASSHANDKERTVEDKINEIQKDKDLEVAEKNKLIALIRLICIVDYLDLGIDRLRNIVNLINWDDKQKVHKEKHEIIMSPEIKGDFIKVTLTNEAKEIVKNKVEKLPLRLEILNIIQKVFYELERHIIKLNNALETQWFLKPLNEDYFGKLFPLSYGIQLFNTIFEKGFRESTKTSQFEIDMLGHSLFSRFVNDEEKLNDRLLKILKTEKVHLRILLLDPDKELQQSCEIFDSQKKKNEMRSILPLYDKKYDLIEKENGDIFQSLDIISDRWQNEIGENSCLKVKLTKKILYASIMRFGGQMIVTPYTMGLSSQSISIVYSKESPIYDAFLNDFELLWDKKDETRLFLSKAGINAIDDNPIKDIIPDEYQNNNKSNFNYENWLLKKCKNRIEFWFENENTIIPPYELEIQPTNTCNLNCTHCIGRHLEYLDLKKSTLEVKDIESIKTLLDWNEGGFKIERLRISGLNGDPLSDAALEFTKTIILRNQTDFKREIVLFTNGLNIDKAINELLLIDTLHISIDAGSKETFKAMKNSKDFDKIFENIRKLKAKFKHNQEHPKIGFGYVVTQRNYNEVEMILDEANKEGIDFIRFKRDIHSPNSISWRSWIEAKDKIEKIIYNKNNKNEDYYPKIDNIFITDLPRHHWNGNTKNCISHKYCLTVGADKNVYTCDHLTSKAYTAIGSFSDDDFNQDNSRNKLIKMIKKNIENKNYCKKLTNCSQCPPFNYRFNYFLPQLESLYSKGNWSKFEKKLDSYVKN